MSFDNTLNVYFVSTGFPAEGSAKANDLESSLGYLRDHISEEHIRQIKASEGFPLIASGQLTKKDVFVLDQFEGDLFVQLQQTKALIIGPRCLISCLLHCQHIPLGTSPVFTTAMRDLQICATGISVQEKEQLRTLVQWMGGYYFQNLGRSITHLVSNTIKSTKYEHATLNGIPVMHVDWVQRVWERSCVHDVLATDSEFDKYRLPIFFGTNITCTGLESEKKNEIMRLVNENGGTYHSAFRSTLVDIVITEKDKTNSDKYKAAVRYKKDILCPEWIFESVQKGFALPTKGYLVKALKVSTPTKSDRSLADFTHMSDISRISVAGVRPSHELSTVNDTISNETLVQRDDTFLTPAAPSNSASTSKGLQREVLRKCGAGEHYRLVYDEICPKMAKKAGNFLDGCCVYLSGFRLEEKEKLNRILNVGGATRYDVVNDKITHIIVGQLDDAEVRAWKKDGLLTTVNIVRLEWLLQSIKLKQPASEVVYRMSLPTTREPDAPSPSSKKTLRSMNHSFKQPDKPRKKLFEQCEKEPAADKLALPKPLASSTELPFEEDEHNLISQYSQENVPAVEVPAATAKPSKAKPSIDQTTLEPPMASSTLKPPAVAAAPMPANATESTESAVSVIDYENLDFFQGMSVYIDKAHFPEEFYSQMISECEAAHGNVVPATFRDPVDYAIVSFERTLDVAKLPVKARYIITELYVESCLKQNKLVSMEYYHQHIPHTADSLPLQGMTIVVSIYTGLERDYIESVAQLLGASVNKTFVKKERPLLVCPRPEGSKYEGAIKWCYPVVTSEWLVQCAVKGEKLAYQTFLVGDSPPEFPVSPALRERNTTNTTMTRSNDTPAAMEVDGAENNIDAGRTDFTPLRNKRVSELAGGVRKSLPGTSSDSPHTPSNNYARPTYSFDYMEGILAGIENEAERECIRELIMEMRQNQTPELERIRRQACTPINRKIPTPKGIPDFCTTPEFQQRMADEFERRWRLPTKKLKPDTPIDEVRRRVMRATCQAMGIPFCGADDPPAAATTLAGKSKTSAAPTTPKPQTPRNNALPRSIFANTSKVTARPSDTFVASTQTPTHGGGGDAVDSASMGIGERASFGNKSSTINFDKISFEETEMEAPSTSKNASGLRSSQAAAASPEIQKIAEYLKDCESRRHSLKRSNGGVGGGDGAAGNAVNHGEAQHPNSGTDPQHYVQPFESEQFGLGTEQMVGWRDPVDFGKERRSKATPSMQHRGTPRFSISCADEDVRSDVIRKILQLGGTISENLVNFDPECSHLVCERPNRGEKLLGCVSSGKWVLSLKYVEECYAKDVFVDEELYEWGNCKALNMPQLTPDEQVIAQAAHRWRRQLNASSTKNAGAFTGFSVILRISERNIEALRNVIKAGKGELLTVTSPFSKCREAHKATHCFVDMKKTPLLKEDYEYLRSIGVQIFTQMYINAYLMHGSDGDAAKYEVKMQV